MQNSSYQPQAPFHESPPMSHQSASEDSAWAHLYRAVRQPPAAAEVVKHLDDDPDARRAHMALYLVARETLHARELEVARKQRSAALIRAVFTSLVIAPYRALRSALPHRAGVKAGAILPALESPANPAKARTRAKVRIDTLRKDPDLAQAIEGFAAPGAAVLAVARIGEQGDSRGHKAA